MLSFEVNDGNAPLYGCLGVSLHGLRAEMDLAASQNARTVIFPLAFVHKAPSMSGRLVCVVSGVLAGCQCVRLVCLLLSSSPDECCHLWLSGHQCELISLRCVYGGIEKAPFGSFWNLLLTV